MSPFHDLSRRDDFYRPSGIRIPVAAAPAGPHVSAEPLMDRTAIVGLARGLLLGVLGFVVILALALGGVVFIQGYAVAASAGQVRTSSGDQAPLLQR